MNSMTTHFQSVMKKVNNAAIKHPFSKNRIYSNCDFIDIVEIERERMNRSATLCSILNIRTLDYFRLSTDNDYFNEFNKFLQEITERTRVIDRVCLVENNQISIVLPYTNYYGTEILKRDIASFPKFTCLNLTVTTEDLFSDLSSLTA